LSGAVLAAVAMVSVEVAVPGEESVRLVELRETRRGYEDVERYTVPVKPLRLVAEIVEVWVDPAVIVRDVGVAAIEKSTDKFGDGTGVRFGETLVKEDLGGAENAYGRSIRKTRPSSARNFQRLTTLRDLDVR
jgi:hypothetical protein